MSDLEILARALCIGVGCNVMQMMEQITDALHPEMHVDQQTQTNETKV